MAPRQPSCNDGMIGIRKAWAEGCQAAGGGSRHSRLPPPAAGAHPSGANGQHGPGSLTGFSGRAAANVRYATRGPPARASSWPGYFGSPRLATAATGEAILKKWVAQGVRNAELIMDHKLELQRPTMHERMSAYPTRRGGRPAIAATRRGWRAGPGGKYRGGTWRSV